MSIDDLVNTIQMGESEGQKTAKITMKNGRTLTMLILTDGKWLSVRDHRVEFVGLQCERGNYHPYAFYNVRGS
jgi:hypothetical protein